MLTGAIEQYATGWVNPAWYGPSVVVIEVPVEPPPLDPEIARRARDCPCGLAGPATRIEFREAARRRQVLMANGNYAAADRLRHVLRESDIDKMFRPFLPMARQYGGYTLDWRDAVYLGGTSLPVIFYEVHEDW